MIFNLLTPHKKLVSDETIDELFVPGFAGQLDVLENHANFVTPIQTGVVRWRKGSVWTKAVVSTGLLEIFDGTASVMADVSELENEIDVQRAQTAAAKAKQKIEEGGLDDENFRKYQLKLARAMARVEASGN